MVPEPGSAATSAGEPLSPPSPKPITQPRPVMTVLVADEAASAASAAASQHSGAKIAKAKHPVAAAAAAAAPLATPAAAPTTAATVVTVHMVSMPLPSISQCRLVVRGSSEPSSSVV